MAKFEEKYCDECDEYRMHKKVGSKSEFEGLGPARVVLAVGSLGISETICREKFWQCTRCGNIIKED